ncbi:MAG: type II toxin-antitoxin system VapC family toxin [Candidatus Sulfotelmatobacter sp.]
MILVDTHVVVWLAFDEARISKQARSAIEKARQNGEGLAISDISLFELARIFNRERTRFAISIESALAEVERRFVVLPISGRISLRALSLPAAYPKDPADRIIGATALVEGMPLITADREIRNSRALPTIW